jgi:hypothetical protein
VIGERADSLSRPLALACNAHPTVPYLSGEIGTAYNSPMPAHGRQNPLH